MTNNYQKPQSTLEQTKTQSQAKKENLARALRDNLKRRKAPAPVATKDLSDEQ